MRLGVILVVCGLAACEVHNGTYFAVDGERAGITFDRIEFFLGKDAGGADQRLHTPGRPFDPQVADGPVERHRMIKRLFTDSDVQTTSATRSLTYYLTTETEGLSKYASYVLVVASRGGVPVGVAEVENFAVRDDGAYVYELDLAPVDAGFEQWGKLDVPGASCARWTRPRGDREVASTYAVVHDGDFDCDDASADKECDDLNYCAAMPGLTPCASRVVSCIASEGCEIGSCSDVQGVVTCAPATCLPEHFCAPSDACDENGSVDDFLTCALKLPSSHIEVDMALKIGGGLCTHTFNVTAPLGLGCRAPLIESPLQGVFKDWTFTVKQSIASSEVCTFTLEGPSPDAAPPLDSHLVISVATPYIERRTSFVIGFQPATTIDCVRGFEVQPPIMATNPTCP